MYVHIHICIYIHATLYPTSIINALFCQRGFPMVEKAFDISRYLGETHFSLHFVRRTLPFSFFSPATSLSFPFLSLSPPTTSLSLLSSLSPPPPHLPPPLPFHPLHTLFLSRKKATDDSCDSKTRRIQPTFLPNLNFHRI